MTITIYSIATARIKKIPMKNKKTAGIGPSKYCNYSLFTLFERSVLVVFFLKIIYAFY